MSRPPLECRVCSATDCTSDGPPAYFRPTKVAAVPIDLSDLRLLHCRCARCGYRFVHPPIPEVRLLDCYRRAPDQLWTTGQDAAEGRGYARKIQLLEQHAPGRRILDFGCFDGGFLTCLPSSWLRFGIEPATAAARRAEARGISILAPTIDGVDPAIAPFDAIIALDVFEHLNYPIATLRGLQRLLKPRGILMIETGNTDCRLWQRAGKHYPYCGIVEHVGFFNRSALACAAEQAQLSLVHFEESSHSLPHSLRLAVMVRLYNLTYRGLRLADRLRLPLSSRLQDIAHGPFPRAAHSKDHFLAILKNP